MNEVTGTALPANLKPIVSEAIGVVFGEAFDSSTPHGIGLRSLIVPSCAVLFGLV